MDKSFNIILVGVGGQGVITLTRILAVAALEQGLDVKTSELHGLSQRGGSVETHIKIGSKIHSPLVPQGSADLVISLELQETLRACYYGSVERTRFLVNNHIVPIMTEEKPVSVQHSPSEFNNFSKKTIFVPGTKLVKKELDKPILAGVFMIGLASFKDFVPPTPESLEKAIKKVVPRKHLKLNKKALQLARRYQDGKQSN